MNKRLIHSIIFLSILLIASCTKKQEQATEKKSDLIKYADKLSIKHNHGYTEVTVEVAKNEFQKYILYSENYPDSLKADAFIRIPVDKVICTSTSHLPAFDLLKSEDKLIGFPGTKWIYDSSLRTMVKENKLSDVGIKQELNIEKILNLQPDIFMTYSMPNSQSKYDLIKASNISVIYNADFMETSPLGRAEWIKFTGLLLNKYDEADSIFTAIEQNYIQLSSEIQPTDKHPRVMTGIIYGDTWYVPGGKSYAAKFIEDAGGNYLWSDNKESGSLMLGFENVLQKASKADLWIGVGSFNTYDELANADERYTYFESFQEKHIYSYTKRMNEFGSNDYLESGYSRPDLVLSDYIKMLHPELDFSKQAEFHYFESLK
ncbi:ABC transporter substrate-binding protein [Marivirga atlantica]|jgi:iron complex transport system substrate-binding protein|uniref:ABC transporter substrate-binding protein n=1 Tax=Marivirga atlantica TaxID=1548457 RepID=A0A937DL07_9BACT|nr:ABC transporter substrate-binding protein [Marivirga atlantica]MBL0766776.1 ABC transporter substrate-binding protein [Marivirga atlantica]